MGIYLPVLYIISPTLKPLRVILLIFQQLLVQAEVHVPATVLFTQDYATKSGDASGTTLSFVSTVRKVQA
jgi:hypothetical protein